jgi:imidazolonepropionase-like amidohydrolase
MDGDLTVLSADPARDVDAFAEVAYTIRGGQILYRPKP